MLVRYTILFLLFLGILRIDLSAQFPENFLSIGVVPTSFLDPLTPSVRISSEYRISENWNAELSYGLDINISPFLNWHPDPDSRHHEYRLALKHLFWEHPDQHYFLYYGADFFGLYNKYEVQDGLYSDESDRLFSFEHAEIKRFVNGGRIIFGIKRNIRQNIWDDWFIGLGIQTQNFKYSTDNQTISPAPIFEDIIKSYDRNEGKKLLPALLVGVKYSLNLH